MICKPEESLTTQAAYVKRLPLSALPLKSYIMISPPLPINRHLLYEDSDRRLLLLCLSLMYRFLPFTGVDRDRGGESGHGARAGRDTETKCLRHGQF